MLLLIILLILLFGGGGGYYEYRSGLLWRRRDEPADYRADRLGDLAGDGWRVGTRSDCPLNLSRS